MLLPPPSATPFNAESYVSGSSTPPSTTPFNDQGLNKTKSQTEGTTLERRFTTTYSNDDNLSHDKVKSENPSNEKAQSAKNNDFQSQTTTSTSSNPVEDNDSTITKVTSTETVLPSLLQTPSDPVSLDHSEKKTSFPGFFKLIV